MVVRHPSGYRKDDKDQSPGEQVSSEKSAGDAGKCKGLCANCANRGSCLLPRSEGGVWHCEEYVEEH